MVKTAQEIVPQMIAAGADIVVALCHGGLDTNPCTVGMENAAIPLSDVDGIDAIVMGHTHDLFPNPARPICPPMNPIAGQLHGKPAVMAGFYGSHLGVVGLDLDWRAGHWSITASHVELIAADTQSLQTPLQHRLTHDLQPIHNKVLETIRQPIAQTELPITSHFANAAPDKTLELLANANRAAIRMASFGTEWEHLPILSAASQFRAGGRGGPSYYIDIPVGPIALRDASAIYPFENRLCAVRRTGAQLENWLNTSAQIFETITQGVEAQDLFRSDFAPYDFDVIFGLTYDIDLSLGYERAKNIRYKGKLVAPTDVFVVATNSFRASGGGNFFTPMPQDILHITTQSSRDILINYLRETSPITSPAQAVWQFSPIAGATAMILTSPNATAAAHPHIHPTGTMVDGFAKFLVQF